MNIRHVLWTPILLIATVVVALAAGDRFVCSGRVVDAEKHPVQGYRVVYRVIGAVEVMVSGPTDANGEYRLELPIQGDCAPVAVISPRGLRIELEDESPVPPQEEGARRDLQIDIVIPEDAAGLQRWAPGAERLYLAFVEDPAQVEHQRWETGLEYADLQGGDRIVSRVTGAFHFSVLPETEFGLRGGYGGLELDDGFETSGTTDLDLWAKLTVRRSLDGRLAYAVGAVLTLPTGDEDAGLGYDGLRSKLFGSARMILRSASLTAHAGVRFNEGGSFRGTPLDGSTAAAAGLGLSVPVARTAALVFEAGYEGKRFSGGDADASVLAGINWKVVRDGVVRFAVAGGLSDGAPDLTVLAGFAFDF